MSNQPQGEREPRCLMWNRSPTFSASLRSSYSRRETGTLGGGGRKRSKTRMTWCRQNSLCNADRALWPWVLNFSTKVFKQTLLPWFSLLSQYLSIKEDACGVRVLHKFPWSCSSALIKASNEGYGFTERRTGPLDSPNAIQYTRLYPALPEAYIRPPSLYLWDLWQLVAMPVCEMTVFLMLSFQSCYLELQTHIKHCDVTQPWPVFQLVSTWKSKELRRLQRSSGSATPTHATPHHTHTHTPQGLSVTLSCCPSHTSHSSAERCLCAPSSPFCTWGHYMCWSPCPL